MVWLYLTEVAIVYLLLFTYFQQSEKEGTYNL